MESYCIKKIEIRGSRAKLRVESVEDPLFLPAEIVVNRKLRPGNSISLSEFEQLSEIARLYDCQNKALWLLGYRAYSTGEMRVKLKQKGFESAVIKKTITYLTDKHYLDDTRYAEKLAKKLVETKPCGRSMIIASLRKKMIDRRTAEQVTDRALEGIDMTEQALEALKKRWSRWEQLELEEAKKKSYTYLSRRGFRFEAAKKAFEIINDTNNED